MNFKKVLFFISILLHIAYESYDAIQGNDLFFYVTMYVYILKKTLKLSKI